MRYIRRKRGQGKRNPIGETKTSIVLYLAGGRRERGDIIDYLREAHNIRDAKTIDDHLNDLVRHGLVEKEKAADGLHASYRLPGDYSGLKRIFQFAAKSRKELELLGSPHFQTTINESIFLEIAKDLLRAVGYIIYSILLDAGKRDAPLDLGTMFYQLSEDKKFLDDPEIGELREELKRWLKPLIEKPEPPSDALINEARKLFYGGHEEKASSILFPPNECREVLQILKSSPSALSFITTFQGLKFKRLKAVLSGYLRYYASQFILSGLSDVREEYKKQLVEAIHAILREIPPGQAPRRTASTPLLIILESLLISDIFAGRAVENDWVDEYYKSLFTPDKDVIEFLRKWAEENKGI